MSNIYYAAPLHNKSDQDRNILWAGKLREAGHKVYLPQECGIWEDMVNEMLLQDVPKEEAVKIVRQKLFTADRDAVGRCDFIVAYFGNREPSEGALWEMGYAYGLGKPVYLFNPKNWWKFNLMPEFGSTVFTEWKDLMAWIKQEEFK